MSKFFDRNATNITISEFYENHKGGKYDYNVSYQRQSGVWTPDKRSFLIDSILKNYPIPPIFMRPNVAASTGKTTYDIVDGKQRLETIVAFIEDEIPLTTDFSDDIIFGNDEQKIAQEISGLLFSEIKKEEKKFEAFIKQFWTYSVNIDYLYEDNSELIATVFDRLNRNGEPLNEQELRKAQFATSRLIVTVQQLSGEMYWQERYTRLKTERMADQEFISELLFLVVEDEVLESSPTLIDELYKKYSESDLQAAVGQFDDITNFLINLNLDYGKLKRLNWTTHLYGLFATGWYCKKNGIVPSTISQKLDKMYTEYFGRKAKKNEFLQQYKESCSSRTKSREQRTKRLRAILGYCGIPIKN